MRYYTQTKAREQHAELGAYAARRNGELKEIFRDEHELLIEYECLITGLVLILGKIPPQEKTQGAIRDLVADVFDTLYVARSVVFQSYSLVAFPLLRHAFECIILIQYFVLKPEAIREWEKKGQLSFGQVRQFLSKHPMGENEDKMKQAYSFFSGGTHVNREYIPHRFLGEGNGFVLGAVAMPDLQGVGEYIRWLVNLWFWFGAVASYTFHKQVVNEPEYQISYRTTAAKCQVVYTALVSKLATFGDT